MMLQSGIQMLMQQLREERAGLVAYCALKAKSNDWHGVQDAGSDIREIDAKLEVLNQVLTEGGSIEAANK